MSLAINNHKRSLGLTANNEDQVLIIANRDKVNTENKLGEQEQEGVGKGR